MIAEGIASDLEIVIGLEVHAQLMTRSKMFCGCSADYANAEPNTLVCPVCLGMPGVLPVVNATAIRYAVMTALAVNCTITEYTKFDRKNYPYPDLMKGYQISQYDAPLSRNGWLDIEIGEERRRVRINRVHIEEDTAKLLHKVNPTGEAYSLVDVNRAGVPLMEIVSEPDLHSPEEARQYLTKLRAILQYLGVSTGNMEEGSFRCDANLSLRPQGSPKLGNKVEVKNMNSFRAVYRALEYEAERQAGILKGGGRIAQETRGWVEEKGITVSQRSKEYAHDYRYFPEPDLPPLIFSKEWVDEIRSGLPELPDAKRDRFVNQYNLSSYDANLLTSSKAMADYFESGVQVGSPIGPKTISNWITGELFHLLNAAGREITDCNISPGNLVDLLNLVSKEMISGKIAKTVLEEMFASGQSAEEIIARRGLNQISEVTSLETIIDGILRENPQAVKDYHDGKKQALTFLVGQIMRSTKGRANPTLSNQILEEKLKSYTGDGKDV